jgi:hypothetical protein
MDPGVCAVDIGEKSFVKSPKILASSLDVYLLAGYQIPAEGNPSLS